MRLTTGQIVNRVAVAFIALGAVAAIAFAIYVYVYDVPIGS